MNKVVEEKRSELEDLCLKFHVAQLEIFGSGAGPAFDPDRSDLDFLVIFEQGTPVEHARRYFGLLAALQDLFERDIDLVMTTAIQNPCFLEGVNKSRAVIYAA